MTQKRSRTLTFPHILLLWLISFLLHTVLNILVNGGPTVVIDEGLYTNIARSLAWEGTIAFRSQPVNYPYILYPVLLVPLYRLNDLLGGDIYRWIQVFNTLLITFSVIPAWFFALDFTRDRRKAFAAALLVTLMPDMVMGGFMMTECLLWPLSLCLIFFAYRWYSSGSTRYGLLTALFSALMFYAKPGAIAFGAVLLLVRLILVLRTNREQLRGALLPILLLVLLLGVIYAVYIFGFGQERTFLGLYDKQTSEWKGRDALVALEAVFLTVFLFVFACGGIFALFPLLFLKEYEQRDRTFILACCFGLLAVILGTAVFVVPYKWDGSLGELPLHLRYSSMFIPAFLVFALAPEQSTRQIKAGEKRIRIAIIVFALLCIFPGARSGFVIGETNGIDSMVLSSFCTTNRLNGRTAGLITTLLMLIFLAWIFAEIGKGWNSKVRKGAVLFYAVFLIFNAVCAHINAAVEIDPTIGTDANEVRQLLGEQTAIGITQRYYSDINSYWLDGRLNRPMQQVTIDQMFLEMEDSGGVYMPFVPVDQSPNLHNHETPDTDLFVLGITIGEHLELSDSVDAQTTANGHFTVARITPGERWVDSMLYGMDDNWLPKDRAGILQIFDETSNLNGELHLSLTAAGTGTLTVGTQTVQLTEEPTRYDFVLPWAKSYPVLAKGVSAELFSYRIERGESFSSKQQPDMRDENLS